jgi:hypothetical protein
MASEQEYTAFGTFIIICLLALVTQFVMVAVTAVRVSDLDNVERTVEDNRRSLVDVQEDLRDIQATCNVAVRHLPAPTNNGGQ